MQIAAGDSIKKFRKQKGYTQKQLAEKAGISSNSIIKYERGEMSPSIYALQKIAAALDVSVSVLIDEGDNAEEKLKPFLENIKYVQNKLCHRDLYEMLAEEAAELSQAALKVIRAEGMSGSVTPITAEEAHANLNEEVVDVLVVLAALNVEIFNAKLADAKAQRWADRLEEKNE